MAKPFYETLPQATIERAADPSSTIRLGRWLSAHVHDHALPIKEVSGGWRIHEQSDRWAMGTLVASMACILVSTFVIVWEWWSPAAGAALVFPAIVGIVVGLGFGVTTVCRVRSRRTLTYTADGRRLTIEYQAWGQHVHEEFAESDLRVMIHPVYISAYAGRAPRVRWDGYAIVCYVRNHAIALVALESRIAVLEYLHRAPRVFRDRPLREGARLRIPL